MQKRIIYSIVALVVLLSGVTIGQYTPVKDASAQVGGGVGNYDIAGNVIVHGNVSIADGNDLILSDDLSSIDDMSVGDDLTVVDDTVTNDIYSTGEVGASRQSTVTVTSGGTVPTTSSFVPLVAGYSAVGTSTVSGCTAGATYSKIVTLYNTGSNTVVFTDTGTLKLTANITLGQTDTLVLRCDTGTGNWLQIATSNN